MTELKGVYRITGSDNRFINNIFFLGNNPESAYGLNAYTDAEWPVMAEGNMECRTPEVAVEENEDGVWLSIDGMTAAEVGALQDGSRLGYAKLSNCAYENADGSPICIDRDYNGTQRQSCTFAGPFGTATVSRIKVW